jgi:histidine ammonia-lyase
MLEINGSNLNLGTVEAVARHGASVRLAAAARGPIEEGRRLLLERFRSGEPVYGVNTGFGDLASRRINNADAERLQERLLLSHAAGVGKSLPDDVVRAMLLLRANTLARGNSGVRVEVVERLLEMLAAGIVPIVPRKGSVGASGDLAPLAHLALPLIGLGRVRVGGREMDASQALDDAGVVPLALGPKEGLALINGTQAMTASLALSASDVGTLLKLADLIGALSTDAFRGTDAGFDDRVHQLRPHPGQAASAANLWRLLQGSEIRESHRLGDLRVQDPYSFRCMPQVHGAARDVLDDVVRKVEIEMNSATDNPLVLLDTGEVVSAGNFHGEPMAMAADFLAIAVCEIGTISERRIEKLTYPAFSGLPAFLVDDPGLNSGFMMAHVTAAALASETKGLAHPASVDSIPTSADKEDHVSMGQTAALKLRRSVRNVRRILAIELLAAAQGVEFLRPLRSSDRLEAVHARLRDEVGMWREDRVMAADIAGAERLLVRDGEELTADLG